jgi:hypothetical protein
MHYLNEIQKLYDGYLDEVRRLEAGRRVTDGLLGFGKGSGGDACHDRFAGDLERLLTAAADAGDLASLLRYIYDAPLKVGEHESAYWMLLAVHRLTEPLIGLLQAEDAVPIAAAYLKAYPRYKRLPVMKKVAKLLKAQAR